MARLISAKILPEPGIRGETQVELTFERPAIALKDWTALHAALQVGDIPMHRRTETRSYASQELAERAIAALGQGRVLA